MTIRIPVRVRAQRSPEAQAAQRVRVRDHHHELDEEAGVERLVELRGPSVIPLGPWAKRSSPFTEYELQEARRRR